MNERYSLSEILAQEVGGTAEMFRAEEILSGVVGGVEEAYMRGVLVKHAYVEVPATGRTRSGRSAPFLGSSMMWNEGFLDAAHRFDLITILRGQYPALADFLMGGVRARMFARAVASKQTLRIRKESGERPETILDDAAIAVLGNPLLMNQIATEEECTEGLERLRRKALIMRAAEMTAQILGEDDEWAWWWAPRALNDIFNASRLPSAALTEHELQTLRTVMNTRAF